jgi:hypothetical protein
MFTKETMRTEMSTIAANAQVLIAKEEARAKVGIAEARYATPARWSAGSAAACALASIAGTIAVVCFSNLSSGDKTTIALAVLGGGGVGTWLLKRAPAPVPNSPSK